MVLSADNYLLMRKLASLPDVDANYWRAYYGPDNNWDASDLPDGDYSVKVRAFNEFGMSDWSPVLDFEIGGDIPEKVMGLDWDISSQILTWIEIAEATNYRIEIRQKDSPTWLLLGNTAVNEIGISEPADEYWLRVRAENTYGNGEWSDELLITIDDELPAKVVNVEFDVMMKEITWDMAARADEYEVEYKRNNEATWQNEGTTADTSMIFAKNWGDYQIRVRATNTNGEGEWSDVITFDIDEIPIINGLVYLLKAENYDSVNNIWIDESAANNDFNVPSGYLPPTKILNDPVFNNRDSISFNANQILELNSAPLTANNLNCTIIVVATQNIADSNAFGGENKVGAVSNNDWTILRSDTTNYILQQRASGGNTIDTRVGGIIAGKKVLSGVIESNVGSLYINESFVGSSTSVLTPPYLGNRTNVGGIRYDQIPLTVFMNGKISNFIGYNRGLSSGELTEVINYLIWRVDI